MRFGGILVLLVVTASAGEFAVFANGRWLPIDGHEMVEGAKIRLYSGSGYIELNAAEIRTFETAETTAAPPPTTPAATEKAAQPTATVHAPATPQGLADAAADKYGLPRKLVRGVMAAESGFRPDAVSAKGAIGLMQLMPATAEKLGADPRDARQNVDAGTRYLRDLLLKYNGALWHALAAYNAGPGAVDRYKDVPPYPETIQYIGRIDRQLKRQD
jgi:soluble lytic murein transglycosylase-like protein